MGIAPGLAYDTKRRLAEIDPCFVPRWNKRRRRWDIWYESTGKRPYIVTPVQDEHQRYIPIDGRTFSKLRRIVWENQQDIMRILRDIEYADELAERASDEREAEHYRQIARENKWLLEMMRRLAGERTGKTKIPYAPGFTPKLSTNGVPV